MELAKVKETRVLIIGEGVTIPAGRVIRDNEMIAEI
jgi:hypothetical protein